MSDHHGPAPCHLEIDLRVDHERTDRVIGLLESILTHEQQVDRRLARLELQGGRTTMGITEIRAKLADLQADVESETDIVTAIDKAFEGQNTIIVDMAKKLAEALANNDPAGMQAVLDSLTTIGETNAANKARTIALILKNTPAEIPVPPPVDPPVPAEPTEPPTTDARGRPVR